MSTNLEENVLDNTCNLDFVGDSLNDLRTIPLSLFINIGVLKDSRNQAEVGGFAPIEAIAIYINKFFGRLRRLVFIKMVFVRTRGIKLRSGVLPD